MRSSSERGQTSSQKALMFVSGNDCTHPTFTILETCGHTLARRLYEECTCGYGHDSGQYTRCDSCTFLFAIAVPDAISILFVSMLLFDLFVLLHFYLFIVMCVFLFAIAVPSAISIIFVYMLLCDLFVLLHIYLFIVMFVHLALVLTFLSVLLHLRLVLFLGWCLFVTLHVCLFVAMFVQQDITLLCLSVFLFLRVNVLLHFCLFRLLRLLILLLCLCRAR